MHISPVEDNSVRVYGGEKLVEELLADIPGMLKFTKKGSKLSIYSIKEKIMLRQLFFFGFADTYKMIWGSLIEKNKNKRSYNLDYPRLNMQFPFLYKKCCSGAIISYLEGKWNDQYELRCKYSDSKATKDSPITEVNFFIHRCLYETEEEFEKACYDKMQEIKSDIKINIQKELIEFSKRYFAIDYYNDIIEKYGDK